MLIPAEFITWKAKYTNQSFWPQWASKIWTDSFCIAQNPYLPFVLFDGNFIYNYHDILTIYDINILHHTVISVPDNSDTHNFEIILERVSIENKYGGLENRVWIQTFDW